MQSSLNFVHSGPGKFAKSDVSGLAPTRRVLNWEEQQGQVERGPGQPGPIPETNRDRRWDKPAAPAAFCSIAQ